MTSIAGSSHRCAVCDAPTEQRCAGCHLQYYCSKPHMAQDWRRHKLMCKTLQNTSLSTVPVPLSTPTPANMGENTFQAIVFPANEDTPRMITIEWEWKQGDDDWSVPWQRRHTRHLFHEGADVRDKQICNFPFLSATALPDDRCLIAIINDNFLIDGSPLNRCIFNLTHGKAGHPWSDNVLAMRQRPQDMYRSLYGSAKLEEDLDVLKNYFLTYNT